MRLRPEPGERLAWLLDLTFAGRIWRFASETMEVTDGSSTRTYLAGLAGLRVRLEAEPLSTSPSPPTAQIEVVWPESVAALIALGHDLSAATAELSMHRVGIDRTWREVVIAGRVVEPDYDEILNPDGSRHSLVTFTVEWAPWDDRATHPAPSAVVSADTWPDRLPDHDGRVYPTVWGRPGSYREADGTAIVAPGSPALIVEYSSVGEIATKLLIAGHRVVSANVTLMYRDDAVMGGWSTEVVDVTHETDGLGQLCAVVDISAEVLAIQQAGDYWICWNQNSGSLLSDIDGAELSTMGHLIEWWLGRSVDRIDRARLASVRPMLDRWKVAGYADEAVSPWDYVADNLLPLVPVSVAVGPDGLYLVPWRWDSTATVATITEGPGVAHVGPVQYQAPPWERCNRRTIRWALDAASNEYLRRTTIGPSPDPEDPDAIGSLVVEQSATRLGVLDGEDLTTDIVPDRDGAALTLLWRAARDAASRRRVVFDCPADYAWIRPGDVVHLVSAHLLIDAAADVIAVELDDHCRARLELEIRPAPPTTGSVVPIGDDDIVLPQ